MSIKITTLIENTKGINLSLYSEHGLSFVIESGDNAILFDTGQSQQFLDNAFNLGIDLSKVDNVVLSHNHYDHTLGLKHFIKQFNNKFILYISEDFFDEKYCFNGVSYEYLGCNFDKEYLKEMNVSTKYINTQITEIKNGIYIVTQFEKTDDWEIPSKFYIKRDGLFQHDDFNDEICLVIESKKGLIVLLGCSHLGVINILNTITKVFNKHIYCVLGGTHLVDANNEQLKDVKDYFVNSKVEFIGVSHCTGETAIEYLKLNLKDRFFSNITGTSITI